MQGADDTKADTAGARKRVVACVRFALFTAAAIVIWKMPSKGVQDALVWLAFLYSLKKAKAGAKVWLNTAGLAFVALFIWLLLSLLWSVDRAGSVRDLTKNLDIAAVAFVITALFACRKGVERLLLYSATGFGFLFAYDLGRMWIHLRGNLLAGAHGFEPFILVHSNVAAMMAGASFMVFLYFAWIWRRNGWRLAGCLLGALVTLAYEYVIASRGPQVALAATVACAGFLLLPGWRGKTIWLGLIIVGGLVLVAGLGRVNPRFLDHASMQGFTGRDVAWEHTLVLSKERPWLGYGYGKPVFVKVYKGSNPPASPFDFAHPHQYWLYVLFGQGWLGVGLHVVAWSLLLARLLRNVFSRATFTERALPGLLVLLLVFIHVYSLADWPSTLVHMMLAWLVPVALIVTQGESGDVSGVGQVKTTRG